MSHDAAEMAVLSDPDFSARVESAWAGIAREFDDAYAAMPVKFMPRTELTFHPYVKLLGYLCLDLWDHPGDVLEIGVWKGRSLTLMQRLCPPVTKVIGVDPCAMEGQDKELPYFHEHVFPDAILVTEFSERAVAEVVRHTRRLKLMHIDGGHNAYNVWADFLLYERFVVPGGYVVFDDYADSQYSPEVKVAVDEMEAQGLFAGFEVIGPVLDYENSFLLKRPLLG